MPQGDLARCSRLHDKPLVALRAPWVSWASYRASLGPRSDPCGPSRPNRPWRTHVPDGPRAGWGGALRGLFAPKPSAIAGRAKARGQTGPWHPKGPPGLLRESLRGFRPVRWVGSGKPPKRTSDSPTTPWSPSAASHRVRQSPMDPAGGWGTCGGPLRFFVRLLVCVGPYGSKRPAGPSAVESRAAVRGSAS
jgi:hypothetical protein